MAQLNFGGVIENVMTREEFPLEKALSVIARYKCNHFFSLILNQNIF